jgi:hypothetical protein
VNVAACIFREGKVNKDFILHTPMAVNVRYGIISFSYFNEKKETFLLARRRLKADDFIDFYLQ